LPMVVYTTSPITAIANAILSNTVLFTRPFNRLPRTPCRRR
jgi:hypothetical protein